MRLAIISLPLIAMLAACEDSKAASGNTPVTTVVASPDAGELSQANQRKAPRPADGYDWAMRIDDKNRTRPAILAYEMTDTDDQPLYFTCEEGGGRIFAGITGGAVNLTEIALTSGDQILRLTGKTEQDEMPSFLSEEIAGDAAFIQAFATNGWLRMSAGGHTVDMAGSNEGAKTISAFVEHCNRP